MSDFPTLFRKYRLKYYQNQQTAAEAAKISRNTVSNWESGRVNPSNPSQLLDVCRRLGFGEGETDELLVALGWEPHYSLPQPKEKEELPQSQSLVGDKNAATDLSSNIPVNVEKLTTIGEGVANTDSTLRADTSGGVGIVGSNVQNVNYYDNRRYGVSEPTSSNTKVTTSQAAPSLETNALAGLVREYLIALQVEFDKYDPLSTILLRTQPGSLGKITTGDQGKESRDRTNEASPISETERESLEKARYRRQHRLKAFMSSKEGRPGYSAVPPIPTPDHNRPQVNLLDYLTQHQRITLLGAPGAGKSTALRWLVSEFGQIWRAGAAERSEKNELLQGWGGRIPIFGMLNRWQIGQELVTFLIEEVKRYSPGLSQKLLPLLNEGRVVLVLDGLNELPQLERKNGNGFITDKRAGELSEIAIRYSNLACVVSCRVKEFIGGPQWHDLHILDLTPSQVEAFAASYYENVDLVAGFISGLNEGNRREKLQGLVAQPFYLLRLLDYYEVQKEHGESTTEALPTNPAQLLKYSVEENIEYQIAQGRMSRSEAEILLAGLSRLAFNLSENQELGVISQEKATTWFWQVPHRPGKRPKLKARLDKQLEVQRYWQLAENCGLIIQNESGIQFYHQLFQEYLCARYCCDFSLNTKFLQRVTQPGFNEVWSIWISLDESVLPSLIKQVKVYPYLSQFTSICCYVHHIWTKSWQRSFLWTLLATLFWIAILNTRSVFIQVIFSILVISPMLTTIVSELPYNHKRRLAVLALGKTGDITASTSIINYLNDFDITISRYAATALTELATKYFSSKTTEITQEQKISEGVISLREQLKGLSPKVARLEFLQGRAEIFKSLGEYELAITDYTEVITHNPKLFTAYYNRGMAYYQLQKQGDAIKDFDRALELNPKEIWVYSWRAVALGSLEDYEKALADFSRVLELGSEHRLAESAYSGLALSYFSLNDYKEAIVNYNRVIDLDPKNVQAHRIRAKCYYKLGEYDKAIIDYNQIINMAPEDIEAFILRGIMEYKLGKYEDALADFSQAAELEPGNTEVLSLRADAYCAVGKYKEALADYDYAIKLNAEDYSLYLGRGGVYRDAGQYKEALDNYNLVIELNPENAGAYRDRGFAKYKLEKYEEALIDYNKAVELGLNTTSVFVTRGNIFYYLKRFDEAIQDYSKIIDITPTNDLAYFDRATAYFSNEQYDEALSDFSKALELNSQNITLYRGRGLTYQMLGKYQEALADYDCIIEIESDNAAGHVGRGKVYYLQGQYDLAINDTTTAIKIDPSLEDAYYCRGLSLAASGDKEKARIDLQKSLELGHDKEEIENTLTKLGLDND